MTRRMPLSTLVGLLAVLHSIGCAAPPTHALVVRHPELKCALVAFSGCAALGLDRRETRRTAPAPPPPYGCDGHTQAVPACERKR